MKHHFVVRAFALCAIVCTYSVPLWAQQQNLIEPERMPGLQPLLDQHPAVTRAQLVVRAHERRLDAARLQRRPTSAFLEAEELRIGDLTGSNVTVGLEREFVPRAERQAEVGIAQAELLAAQATLQGIQILLTSRAQRSVVELFVHQRIARRLAEEDTLLQRAAVTLNTRFSVGDARYIDVIRLRTERLRVQADLVDAQTAVSRAMLDLRALVGADVALPADTGDPLRLPTIAANADSLVAAAPVLLVAQAEQQRAAAAIAAARARGARSWSASLGLQRFPGEGGGGTFGPAIGASLTLPQFYRRVTDAAVQIAQVDSAAAAAGNAALLRSLQAAVSMTRSQLQAIGARISGVDQQLIAAAREERQAALIAYANGQLTLTELLDFERSLSRAEIQLLESYDSAVEAWYELNRQLAGDDFGIDGGHK